MAKDLNTILCFKKNNDSVIVKLELLTKVDLILENLQHEMNGTQAKIVKDLEKVTTIRCVKAYFDSIIYNLVSNAIKYRHPDPRPCNTDLG